MVRLERIAIISIWMLDPEPTSLIEGLSQRGFITAKVKPAHDAYNIVFIEPPNVIATKGLIRVCYDFGRRSLTVEGQKVEEVLGNFKEVEDVLEGKGVDPNKGVLTYDLQVRAKVEGLRLPLAELNTDDILGFKMLALPSLFIMKEGDPNTAKWLDLRLTPVWATWGDEMRRVFDLMLIYRESKERLLQFAKDIEKNLNELLGMIAGVR